MNLIESSPHIHNSWVWMRGADAFDFLHRLTTVDVKNLKLGHQAQGLFLNPQGKIITAFTLIYTQKDELAFLIQDNSKQEWQSALLKIIDQFTFAEKFKLTAESDWKTAYLLDSKNELKNEFQDKQYFYKDEMHWVHHGIKKYGTPLVSVSGPQIRLSLSTEPISLADAETKRIINLYPELEHEIKFDSNPLEIGLMHAVASQKGCYPGQEVIEKIVSLGSPAKRLAFIKSDTPLTLGQTLYIETNAQKVEVGTITSTGGSVALGLVKKTASKEGLQLFEPKAKIEKLAPYES